MPFDEGDFVVFVKPTHTIQDILEGVKTEEKAL